jgi:hypothetical protein
MLNRHLRLQRVPASPEDRFDQAGGRQTKRLFVVADQATIDTGKQIPAHIVFGGRKERRAKSLPFRSQSGRLQSSPSNVPETPGKSRTAGWIARTLLPLQSVEKRKSPLYTGELPCYFASV